jgi:4-amino-4-deoxy-L-arabinose transferase-like glycosyltransferase
VLTATSCDSPSGHRRVLPVQSSRIRRFFICRASNLGGGPPLIFQSGFFDYYRPLTFLTHAIDWEVWGLQPFGYHLRSLLLHAGCTVFVLLVGRRMLAGSTAVVAALLFAVHPASHEAVYWMAARFDLMATFFLLVSIWCLSDDRLVWRAVGLVAFALALLSKESAISLVLIAPAWDVFVGRRTMRAVVRRLLPLLAVVAIYAIVRSLGADLDAAGGARRTTKVVMAAAALLAIVFAARRN